MPSKSDHLASLFGVTRRTDLLPLDLPAGPVRLERRVRDLDGAWTLRWLLEQVGFWLAERVLRRDVVRVRLIELVEVEFAGLRGVQ